MVTKKRIRKQPDPDTRPRKHVAAVYLQNAFTDTRINPYYHELWVDTPDNVVDFSIPLSNETIKKIVTLDDRPYLRVVVYLRK